MNNRITSLVQGSSDEPYEVDFYKEDDKLRAFCTCMAGENRTYCKHRLSILAGSEKHIVSANASEVACVHDWLSGTPLEAAIAELNNAEAAAEAAKNALTAVKRKLADVMHN